MPKSEATKAGKKASKKALKEALLTSAGQAPVVVAPSKYAPTAWGTSSDTSNLHDLLVPSGQLVQVRHVGPTGLLSLGLLDSLDVLGGLVQTEHVERVSGRAKPKKSKKEEKQELEQQMRDVLADPAKIMAAMAMMDKVTCGVVVQPRVLPVPVPRDPEPEELIEHRDELDENGLYTPPRINGQVYVDTVDPEDKAFILNFVMGAVNDLEDFRKGLQENMAALEPVQDVPVPAKRAAPRKRAPRSVPAE